MKSVKADQEMNIRMYIKGLRRELDNLIRAAGPDVASYLLKESDREYWIKFVDSFLRSDSWPKDHEDIFYLSVRVDPKLREVSIHKIPESKFPG